MTISEYTVRCHLCSGCGFCALCQSSGGNPLQDMPGMMTPRAACGRCNGSGKCRDCSGVGHYAPYRPVRPLRTRPDPGFALCPACKGTRECNVCFGTTVTDEGNCQSCDYGTCDICNGTGQEKGVDESPSPHGQQSATQATRTPAAVMGRALLTIEMGSEHAPDDPIGRERLTITSDGTLSYQHRWRGAGAELAGAVSPERATELFAHVTRSGFPAIPSHSIPPGASLVVMKLDGEKHEEVTFSSHFAEDLPGYGQLLAAVDSLTSALRKDDAAALAAWGFKATPAAGGA